MPNPLGSMNLPLIPLGACDSKVVGQGRELSPPTTKSIRIYDASPFSSYPLQAEKMSPHRRVSGGHGEPWVGVGDQKDRIPTQTLSPACHCFRLDREMKPLQVWKCTVSLTWGMAKRIHSPVCIHSSLRFLEAFPTQESFRSASMP